MLVTQNDQARSGERVKLEWMEATSKTGTRPIARVALSFEGEVQESQAQGDGPVDAIFAAIEKLVGSGARLLLYSVNNITSGTDSQGEVTVRLARDGRIVNGLGADTDIVFIRLGQGLHQLAVNLGWRRRWRGRIRNPRLNPRHSK